MTPAAVRRRATLLGTTVTLGAAGLLHLAAGPASALVHDPASDPAGLLVQACALAVLVATALLWTTTAGVVIGQLRGPGLPARPVGPVRSVLLAACGVAVLAGPATAAEPPAPATPASPASPASPAAPSIAGLPLPDRPSAAAPASPTPARTVVVRPGDSLWAISARALGAGARPADVASYGRRVHALNRAVIGPDADLVLPGQRLRLPPAPPA